MMNFLYHRRQLCTLLSLMLLAAVPAFGRVPQDVTYTGRLVNDSGNPLAGPVDLELRVFDDPTAGTQLYSEQHLQVALDATGGFSVQLGLGTSPVGTFDAALFKQVNRWLEVVVGADVLAPRPIIASVPWTLVAQQANAVVPYGGRTVAVDCDAGDVLQEAIDAAGPRTIIEVAGTCSENITVSAWQQRLTIDGQGSASITAASGATVTILGRDITIKGFNGSGSIGGTGRGIVLAKTASATIQDNTIESGPVGISVEENSYALIRGNTVQSHSGNGIALVDGSSADIGGCGAGQPNTIQQNGGSGISLNQNSEANILGNQILGNTSVGIFVADNSMADTGSNDISGNVDGVDVRRGSSVRLGRTSGSGCVEDANFTNGADNTQFGIQCHDLSTVQGRLGTLGGTSGNELNNANLDCPDCCATDLAP